MSRLKTPSIPNLLLGVLPTVLLFAFIFLFPLIFCVRYSLFDWTGGNTQNFVGLQNFAQLLHDASFWKSFTNTLLITVMVVIGQVGIGLFVAVVLVLNFVKYRELHRTAYFLPVVLSPVVVGLVWTIIYNSRNGILNLVLGKFGITNFPLWLDNPSLVLLSVSIPVIWQYFGLYMIMFLGALHNIPETVLESATLDGVNGRQKMFKIMLPLIYPTFKVAVMLCVSGTLKIFDHIFVLTGGGPGESSMTMTLYNYNVSFTMMQFSYGSAVSLGIICISLVITFFTMKSMGGKQYE